MRGRKRRVSGQRAVKEALESGDDDDETVQSQNKMGRGISEMQGVLREECRNNVRGRN